jgi:hypothetical protein
MERVKRKMGREEIERDRERKKYTERNIDRMTWLGAQVFTSAVAKARPRGTVRSPGRTELLG